MNWVGCNGETSAPLHGIILEVLKEDFDSITGTRIKHFNHAKIMGQKLAEAIMIQY